jgi:hypothetical protein
MHFGVPNSGVQLSRFTVIVHRRYRVMHLAFILRYTLPSWRQVEVEVWQLATTMAAPEQNLPETHARLADLLRTKLFSFGRGDEELSSVALAAAKSTFDSGPPKKTCIVTVFDVFCSSSG